MKAAVRHALRTLVGPWLVLPAIGLEAANFLQRGMPWRGEGMWTVEWFAISLLIIGPLCAGAAAVDAARLSRPGNLHLAISVPRPGRVWLRAAMWCAGPLVVLHALAIATGVVLGAVSQPSAGWQAMLSAALIQCVAILWFAAAGSAIGRFATPLLAGLIGGAGGFALSYILGDSLVGDRFQLLAFGAATVTLLGRAYNPAYLGGQAALLVTTSLLYLLLPVRARSGRRSPGLGGCAVGAFAIAIIAAAPVALPANRTIDDPRPPTHCIGSRPQVCMYHEHRRHAGVVLPRVRTLTRAAVDHGYDVFVPVKVVEASHSYHPRGPGIRPLWLPATVYEEGTFSLEQAAYFLLYPSHCEQLRAANPPPQEFDRLFFSLLATWLRLAGQELDHTPAPYHILSPEEARAALDAFVRCDLDGGD